MKTFFVLAFIVVFFPSCGRDENTCKNKETMRLECRAVNQPAYGYGYAREVCDRSYDLDRCY
jgi:hypothetical protein